jgi:8-oxoguanine deaminase
MANKTLLAKNADCLVTMDAARRELRQASLYAVNGIIEAVGPSDELPQSADRVIDLTGQIVLPGFVNCHHHLNQTLTRAMPAAQNADLFTWLRTLYEIWAKTGPEASRTSVLIGCAELALSGCTTVFDHSYIFKNGNAPDVIFDAAAEIGLRFHGSRGSMSLGQSHGGLPPDALVEREDAILADCVRLIEKYHDPAHGAMRRVVLAPCSPFSVSESLLRETAAMARHYGVGLHTHLGETHDETAYTLDRFQLRPLEWMDQLGWHDRNQLVWYAHAVHFNDAEIGRLAQCGCGICHCPSSNMRLASGIAPVKKYSAAGVPVGLGVDGSASNDQSHMLAEVRQAFLLARLDLALSGRDPAVAAHWMSAREALELATLGGARVLGRDDIGVLATGKCADFFSLDLNTIDYAGGLHDAVAAVVFCAPQRARYTVVHGEVIVDAGAIARLDMAPIIRSHNDWSRRLAADH